VPITVVSSSPVDNETGVSIQKRLRVTFSTAVLRSSVNEGTLILYETDGGLAVPGKIDFDTGDTIVYFLPTQELRASFSYTFVAVGAADGLPAGAIQSTTLDDLAVSYSVDFRTGTERFVSLEEVTDRTDIEHVAPIRESEELAETTGVLSILGSVPVGFSSNNNNPGEITVQFDEPLASGSYAVGWMTVEMRPVLDYEDYYYGGLVDGEKVLRIENPDDYEFPMPSGSIAVDGDSLVWTKTSGDWPYNAEVVVTLSPDVEGESGNKLGSEVVILFTTTLWPMYIGSQYLRLELGPALKELYDDTLNRIALKRSIEGWELAGREFSLKNPPYAAREFAKCGAILDVIETLVMRADLQRGMSKKLGDFEVNYGNRGLSKDSLKYGSALECLTKAEAKLRRWVLSLRPRFARVGEFDTTGPNLVRGVRNWDNIITSGSSAIPAANWGAERRSKIALESLGQLYSPFGTSAYFYGQYQGSSFYLLRSV
jgi:hypothetical protein